MNGIAYDTETATFVARGEADPAQLAGSQASWSLYQKPQGAWFEVVAGHDGVTEECNPLTSTQARRFLEVNANGLVERYFGPMPEPAPPPAIRFSRRTVIAAIEVLEARFTHAALSRFVLKLGPDFSRRVGAPPLSVANRINNLISMIDQSPNI